MFVISGEGRTDFGVKNSTHPGPMRILLDIFAGQTLDCFLVERCELSQKRKEQNMKSPMLRGAKDGSGKIWYDEAKALTSFRHPTARTCGFILFRDRDTNDFAQMRNAMRLGFKDQGQMDYGIAMIPCPTSEAWLLAHFQERPYENCAKLESLASVKSDSNSPSSILAGRYNCTVGDIYKTIEANGYKGYEVIRAIDWNRVDMPSFNQFKSDFLAVAKHLAHSS